MAQIGDFSTNFLGPATRINNYGQMQSDQATNGSMLGQSLAAPPLPTAQAVVAPQPSFSQVQPIVQQNQAPLAPPPTMPSSNGPIPAAPGTGSIDLSGLQSIINQLNASQGLPSQANQPDPAGANAPVALPTAAAPVQQAPIASLPTLLPAAPVTDPTRSIAPLPALPLRNILSIPTVSLSASQPGGSAPISYWGQGTQLPAAQAPIAPVAAPIAYPGSPAAAIIPQQGAQPSNAQIIALLQQLMGGIRLS